MSGVGMGGIGTIGHGGGTDQAFGSGHARKAAPMVRAGKDGLKQSREQLDGRMDTALRDNRLQAQKALVGGVVRDEQPTTSVTRVQVDISHASVRCSAAAYSPFEERVSLWRERLGGAGGNPSLVANVYRRALARCEAPTWRERSKLLSLLLDAMPSVPGKVALWRVMFRDLGTADSLYRSILARVRTPVEARQLHDALGLKSFDPTLLEKMLKEAKSPEDRVNKLRKLVDAWPDDFALALRLLDMLEDLGDDAGGRALAKRLRARPDADARLRTAVGELYLRAASRAKDDGDKALDAAEAKRAFGEIVEFAPDDPVARRRLGDLLRAHGWFAEAERQYQTLARLSPEDPSVALLLAAAAEGLGRLEEAVKWTEKGGAAGAPDVAQGPAVTARALASTYLAWGLDEARKQKKPDEEKAVAARLARVLAITERTQKAELRGPRAARAHLVAPRAPRVALEQRARLADARARGRRHARRRAGAAAAARRRVRRGARREGRARARRAPRRRGRAHRALRQGRRPTRRRARPRAFRQNRAGRAALLARRRARRGGEAVSVPMRLTVLRGDRFDVAEWVPGEPEWFDRPPPSPSSGAGVAIVGLVATLVILVATIFLVRSQRPDPIGKPLVATTGDLSAVHAGVRVGDEQVMRLQRVSVGDVVETDADGRARLRLDDGTGVVLDRSTKVALTPKGLRVDAGRAFLQGVAGARAEIDLGDGALAIVSGATAAVERSEGGDEDLRRLRQAHRARRHRGADGARRRDGDVRERKGDDRARARLRRLDRRHGEPLGRVGRAAPRRRRAVGAAGFEPDRQRRLAAHDPRARGERVDRPRDRDDRGEDHLLQRRQRRGARRLPDGDPAGRDRVALRRDARRRGVRGPHRDGVARPGALVASGEVLEWAGEGWVRATVPNIASGQQVSVIVEYVEWLTPRPREGTKDVVVQYRYPMVGAAAAPLVSEFRARVDASRSKPLSVASGLGASVSAQSVIVTKHDFRPTADLVVDVEIPPVPAPARAYFAPSFDGLDHGDAIVVRTEAPSPATRDRALGVALAIVLDVSGSIEPALLDAEKSLCSRPCCKGLGARDRVVVLAADQTARAIGPRRSARRTRREEGDARGALRACRPAARPTSAARSRPAPTRCRRTSPPAWSIYVGDGWPTVGDGTVDAILARPRASPRTARRASAQSASVRS